MFNPSFPGNGRYGLNLPGDAHWLTGTVRATTPRSEPASPGGELRFWFASRLQVPANRDTRHRRYDEQGHRPIVSKLCAHPLLYTEAARKSQAGILLAPRVHSNFHMATTMGRQTHNPRKIQVFGDACSANHHRSPVTSRHLRWQQGGASTGLDDSQFGNELYQVMGIAPLVIAAPQISNVRCSNWPAWGKFM